MKEAPHRFVNTCRPLIDLIYKGEIEPGKVFDLELPIDEAPKGYEAMDQRTATKVLLTM